MKKIFLNLSLLTFSCLFCCFLAELTLRLLGYKGEPYVNMSEYIIPQNSEILDWRYKPNSSVIRQGVEYKYNSQGFRDEEHNLTNHQNSQRIAVIGDSVTEGYGVEYEQIFSRNLQAKLGENYEVLNIAQGGLNAPQVIYLLKDAALKYQPNFIIYNLVLNDCDFFTQLKPLTAYQQKQDSNASLFGISIPPYLKRSLKSSAFIYFVITRISELLAKVDDSKNEYFQRIWESNENRVKVSKALEDLAQVSKTTGITILVVIWPIVADFSKYPIKDVHEFLKSELEKNKLDYLDLLPEFSKHQQRELQISKEDSIHPNYLGHDIATRAVINKLFLPRPGV